ncbi:uncharacterized protein LOC134824942 [Bolinopsis microptera]|uniref:uncharacterized protein LOC134824942 n=1 Tax=Bolinopsis microptera TaxID=2820187 RepID=UPI003078FF02
MDCLESSHWHYFHIDWNGGLVRKAQQVLQGEDRRRRDTTETEEGDVETEEGDVEFETEFKEGLSSLGHGSDSTMTVKGSCLKYFRSKMYEIRRFSSGEVGCTVQQTGKRVKIICHYKKY